MFGIRRHAAPVQPLTRETANANAATAAVSAFKRRASDASLSSAAAAAALRARPTSPTNVADVQSKRLSRRSPSHSPAAGRRRELTRTPSVGSMMERTFRSPSPGRPGRSPVPMPYDVPPIPNMPSADSYQSPSRPISSSRKKSTLQTQKFRTASEKMGHEQQGSWFGAASVHDLNTVRRTTSDLQLSSVRTESEPRPGSVSPSINFSYPRARLQSPSGSLRSSQAEDQTLIYDPNSRRLVPRAQLQIRDQVELEEEYDQPFKKERSKAKKQPKQPEKQREPKQPRLSRAGSHLARGTVARIRAPAQEDNKSKSELDPVLTTISNSKVYGVSNSELDVASPRPQTKTKQKKRVQPDDSVEPVLISVRDSVVGDTLIHSNRIDKAAPAARPVAASQNIASSLSASDKIAKLTSRVNVATPSPNSKLISKAVVGREASESPARSARFASFADHLLVRHEPPSRSLSPRKSALKHSSPTRAISPSDDDSEISGALAHLTPNDEAPKKSYRVSWDDRKTMVVSEPTTQHFAEKEGSYSQQTKKTWQAVAGKSTKKDVSVEKDETMSPRPALPSFGSVREKKHREQEERPLVRPEHAVQADASVTIASSYAEPNAFRYREPLPPLLPSVETDDELSSSDGYLMEDTSDCDLESEAETTHSRGSINTHVRIANLEDATVPKVSVSHASPCHSVDIEETSSETLDVPERDIHLGSEDTELGDAHGPGTGLQMDDIEEEEEEEGHVYSDAYEELTEEDGNNFLSLVAVLESSTNPPKAKATAHHSVEKHEIISADSKVDAQADPADDWENAKAYWKSLSSEKRRQLEQEAMTEADDDSLDNPKTVKTDVPKQTSKHSDQDSKLHRAFSSIQSSSAITDSKAELSSSQQSKANGKILQRATRENQDVDDLKRESGRPNGGLHKSMRAGRPGSAGAERCSKTFDAPSPSREIQIRRTLRGGSSDRSGAELSPSLRTTRHPASHHESLEPVFVVNNTSSLGIDGSASRASPGRGAGIKISLGRRGSDSSESSFTRSRAGSSDPNKFRKHMRGSMRSPSATSNGVKESSGSGLRSSSPRSIGMRRNSVSSLSPVASNFGKNRMRHSLRNEPVETPSRRRISAFGKSATNRKNRGKGGSRFGDSSDEDEGDTNFSSFKSRFADSSSEDDEPQVKLKGKFAKSLRTKTNLRPRSSAVDSLYAHYERGYPSVSENNILLTKSMRAEAGQHNGPGRGAGVVSTQMDISDENGHGFFRPRHNRRDSLISLLRRKKNPASRIHCDDPEAATQRDISLECNPEESEVLRSVSMNKRGPAWPLSELRDSGTIAAKESPERPSTAAGSYLHGSSRKPINYLRRRSASHGMLAVDVGDEDDFIADTATPKKKKFGALRKIFRLHD